ncbi:MAG: acetate--CoA ligase family protein [Candidatus Marsarchaeota archaeon]|jgi:succinyl-CoA synthetase beta subunit|nr:acetate--CoA ligase family protein [Candidatus Marsarchaeota archaeon]
MARLLEYEKARILLDKYGIRSVDSKYLLSEKDAAKFAEGGNIAMKAISQKALHKTKSGLVMLNVSRDNAEKAFAELSRKAEKYKPYKILGQRMAPSGLEIIVGGRTDEQFGKLILIGLGGIYVEVFRDFALRVCPISRHDAEAMIGQLKSKSVIAKDAGSEHMLVELLLKVSKMLSENDIAELDLNPIILHDKGYDAVDLRVMV